MHDDIVHYGNSVQTQEIKIVPLWLFNSRSIFSKNIEITKFFFIKTALVKNKIIKNFWNTCT